MASTYSPIATQTLGSAANSITFSSIPNTYTDLRLVFVANGVSAGGMAMQFNSDTSNNYSTTYLTGNGSGAYSGAITNNPYVLLGGYYVGISSSLPNLQEIDIFSYAGSTYKTTLHRYSADQNGSGESASNVSLWRSTSAITSIKLSIPNSVSYTFGAGTTATLYGIKAA